MTHRCLLLLVVLMASIDPVSAQEIEVTGLLAWRAGKDGRSVALLARDGRTYSLAAMPKGASVGQVVSVMAADPGAGARLVGPMLTSEHKTHRLRGTLHFKRATKSLECYLAGGGEYVVLAAGELSGIRHHASQGPVLLPTGHAKAKALAALDGKIVEVVATPDPGTPWTRPSGPASYPSGLDEKTMIGAGLRVYSVRAVNDPYVGAVLTLRGTLRHQRVTPRKAISQPSPFQLLGPPSGVDAPGRKRTSHELRPSKAVPDLTSWNGKYVAIRAIWFAGRKVMPDPRGSHAVGPGGKPLPFIVGQGYIVLAIEAATPPHAPPGGGSGRKAPAPPSGGSGSK